ncbi:MAG TPA: response regulator [Lichenihabitans sp.]|nr:response regulator [Lichenihabitans sp.]
MVDQRSVLVVEDDPMLRCDAAALLADAGIDVVEMESADNALAYVFEQAESIGAIFTDVQMPGDTDGLDLAQYVASNWPHITVLVTSGRVHPCCELPGNIKFVSKPWMLSDVLGALRPTLGNA